MPSPNKPIVSTLIETVKNKVEPAKLYDALQKMNTDLNKTYEALFEGPLPKNSGKNLDLTELPRTSLPSGIAFVDVANVFTQDQTIKKTRSTLILNDPSSGINGRAAISTGGNVFFSDNLYYDGTNWVTDTAAPGSMIFQAAGYNQIYVMPVGGPLTLIAAFNPNLGGLFHMGNLPNTVGLNQYDMVVPNTKKLAGVNAAGTASLSMVLIDAFDLVQLGSKSAGNTNPNGSPAIPTVANADLPAAGANNNGIILIDKTNHRICWYDSGNRYYAAGTAF